MRVYRNIKRMAASVLIAGLLCGFQASAAFGATGFTGSDHTGPGVQNQGEPSGGQEKEDQEGAQTALPGALQGGLQVNYSAYASGQGWNTAADNQPLSAASGTWITAVKANLVQIPEGISVGIRYQVNLSGSGWLDWAADGAELGGAAGEMPLEAVRMELTGQGASAYDLYYKVYQNGTWTDWALNGASSGTEGAGLRVDGIRASVMPKGAGAPADVQGSFNIDPSKPMIALTFDDGPRSSVTNRILDSLKANGGRATFFMVGSSVNANRDVIARMVEQGCQVANHTHDHKYLTKLNAEGIASQIGMTNQKIADACGVAPVVMRPPGGYTDANSQAVLAGLGMPAIMWSIDTRDWQHRDSQKTIDSVLSQVKDGDIILMHDLYAATAEAAEFLIPELTARGYQLVTVSELAAARGGLVPGQKYSRFRP